MRKKIQTEIEKVYKSKKGNYSFKQLKVNDLSYEQFSKRVSTIGAILNTNDSEQIIVLNIKCGFGKLNNVVTGISFSLTTLNILMFSEEGLIKQNLSEKAFNIIKEEFESNKNVKKKVNLKSLLFVFVALAILIIGSLLPSKRIINQYNEKVTLFNTLANEYNLLTEDVSVINLEGFPSSIQLRKTMNTNIIGIFNSYFNGLDIFNLKNGIEVISLENDILEKNITILNKINNPSEEWIINHLRKINSISGIEAVTKDNDPNKHLNVDGGYTACIYFSIEEIDQTELAGKTVIDKGTDCGGCIEVYKTKKDAENRIDYLSGFDGTILYTGSYACIGTIVIRTSYKLTNNQQIELTNQIVQQFTQIN